MENWQATIRRLDQLISGSGNRAWEIAKNLKSLCGDVAFIVHCGGDRVHVEQRLAKYAQAIGRHLEDLLQMLEHFPKKSDWKDGELVALYDKTCRLIATRRKPYADGEKVRRRRVSREQYEALQKKYRAAQAEIRRLRKIIAANPKLAKVA